MSARILPDFEYLQPRSLRRAVSLLTKYGEKAKLMAGGTDLLVSMKARNLRPSYIVDLGSIPKLDYVECNEEGLRIGATATLRAVEKLSAIQETYTALHEALTHLGSVQVRNMGTVSGNLCNASPAADTATPLIAIKAEARIRGPSGYRVVALEDFFLGPGKTVLKNDEILTEVRAPLLPPKTGTAYMKIGRTEGDLAKVNATVAITTGNSVCEDVRIVLGAVAPTPIRAKKAEEALKGKELTDEAVGEAAARAAEEAAPISDVRSTAEYRRDVCKVFVRSLVRRAAERASKR
jgi:carbon-monoxide dehydrogenase medium subunit